MSTKTKHQYTGSLEIIECAACHQDFGMLPRLVRDRRADHKTFYCPSGHNNYFPSESTEERLRRELAAAEGAAASQRAAAERAREETARTRRRLSAAKGQITKMRKRIAAGVCPVPGCRRSGFAQVMRHLASKHPAWLAEHAEHIEAGATH